MHEIEDKRPTVAEFHADLIARPLGTGPTEAAAWAEAGRL